MRKIKFRAISKFDNEFVYGSLIKGKNYDFIITDEDYEDVVTSIDTLVCQCHPIEKDSETIGQYTGVKDIEGKEIYEGDIIEYINTQNRVYKKGKRMQGIVDYDDKCHCFMCRDNFQRDFDWVFGDEIKFIGTIYKE